MKLIWGRHTCAIGIHILLEEIGQPYEAQEIDVQGGATQTADFQTLNPKGKVPTLVRDDGSVLTEYGAIATWLARINPQAGLIPDDPEAEARALEIMDYTTGTLHAQGFGRIFLTGRFLPSDLLHETLELGKAAVRRQGRSTVEEALRLLDRAMADKPYAAGQAFTIADTALFYAERWAPQVEIALPPNLDAHFRRMCARPAVQRVRAVWGEA